MLHPFFIFWNRYLVNKNSSDVKHYVTTVRTTITTIFWGWKKIIEKR